MGSTYLRTCILTPEAADEILRLRTEGKSYRQISRACLKKGLKVYPADITRWQQKKEKVFIDGEEYDFAALLAAADAVRADEALFQMYRIAQKGVKVGVEQVDRAQAGGSSAYAMHIKNLLNSLKWRLDKMTPDLQHVTGDLDANVKAVLMNPESPRFRPKE